MTKYMYKQQFIDMYLREINSLFTALDSTIGYKRPYDKNGPYVKAFTDSMIKARESIVSNVESVQRITQTYIVSLEGELDFPRHESRYLLGKVIYENAYQHKIYVDSVTCGAKLYELLGKIAAFSLARDILTEDYIPTMGTRALRHETEIATLCIANKVIKGEVQPKQ